MNVKFTHIPEEIIVHTGPCDKPCRNINVFFADYIKNTVSREINPLWNTDAAEAIIYAVTTCVLYKINTGWYRKKGYDFDITLWHEEDMLYEPDKEVYLNIGIMVDELFDNYISIDGDFPGLITCSDSDFEKYKEFAIRCAEGGMKPIEILKAYFGENIEITDKTVHDNDIFECCTFPLKHGDMGENVRIIQENLNFISRDFPAVPSIMPVENFFSKSTEVSVRCFQKNFYLHETGEVDKSTWYKIRKYYFDASRLYRYIDVSKNILTKNIDDIDDEEVMCALNVVEYFNPYINIEMLRTYDKDKHIKNIEEFQDYYNLVVTGKFDNTTFEKLAKLITVITDNIPVRYFDNRAGIFSGKILSEGDRGNEVIRLQSYLRTISKNSPKIKFYDITGVYDDATEKAVINYQKLYGLPANGIVGAITWRGIADLYNYFLSSTCNH